MSFEPFRQQIEDRTQPKEKQDRSVYSGRLKTKLSDFGACKIRTFASSDFRQSKKKPSDPNNLVQILDILLA